MTDQAQVQSILTWLQSQQHPMTDRLIQWAEINSGTHNLQGLSELSDLVLEPLESIADTVLTSTPQPQSTVDQLGELQERPLGDTLIGLRRKDAPRQVVLAIHLDTVYPSDSPFQHVRHAQDRLHGPGVADAKGGLVVLLAGLAAFERYAHACGNTHLGWRVILNCDEEIGSPGSRAHFQHFGSGADFGLLYEPCLPNGHLIGQRKGSGNFEMVVRGQSAHAGREFSKGRNAIIAAAGVAQQLHQLNGRWPETAINVAKIDGGGPSNVVPDTAVVRFNIRYPSSDMQEPLEAEFDRIATSADEGISITRHGGFFAPPKPLTPEYQSLLETVQGCGQTLGLNLAWESTGGVCDGNRLAELGVPNVDTMGVQGGNIHSPQEYMLPKSLVDRAQLTFVTLVTMAERFRAADG